LYQECLTHWYFVKDQYREDGKASYRTFLDRVTKYKLYDILKSNNSAKRRPFFTSLSIDDVSNGEGEPMHTNSILMAFENGFQRIYEQELPEVLLKAMDKLSRRQRELCRLLGEGDGNLQEVVRQMNVPRATLQDEIKRIKKIFRNEGLEDFLKE
jgi:DNA-directed RNA polymerase specialized sigma24 family protein